ncbi:guanine nucleotide exchange factor subunit RIC1-like [Paramacrobiotus metropolitanus]|uniref:guanine nucleotide exchange factor subunit RIC1-like n=1 Tax=Paramacrobiotus metropolitanus TaxID=2943436 RepID=UPI0024457A0F|nr:guanine nucleotide exchange factor subunit RIC1-like [Paramacrobiotus metropolitanus]XP_055330758.1 guanine nucleotide exchange factor subunit RIC1-like [Paramacrobiotus metropolitanus]
MYFPSGLAKVISTLPQEEDDQFQYICCNRERIFCLILRKYSIAIWQLRPLVQLTAYRRSEMSIRNLGHNVSALWKPDSSAIVVQTVEMGLVFFEIDADMSDNGSYQLEDVKNSKRVSDELYVKEMIPYISVALTASILVSGKITSLESLRDHVLVSTSDGFIQRIQWDGSVSEKMTLVVDRIPFSVDFPQSKKSYLPRSSVHVVDMDYSFLLGGFSVVFSNGRGALLTSTHSDFIPDSVYCVWVPSESTSFTCTAVNHKYRLMAFGCENAQGALYSIEDQTEGIQLTHRLQLLDKDCPDMVGACGPVVDMNWTPDGCALAVIWKNGGFSIWSVFGALMTFCLSVAHEGLSRTIKALDWGTEGYSLWLMDPKIVFTYSFLKSALAMNNCSTNRMYVLLQGEQCLYLNTGDRVVSPPHGAVVSSGDSSYKLFSNKAWTIIQLAYRYLATNCPLRYAVVDADAEAIAVAGRFGLAHYSVSSRKWKTFANDTAEQLFVVTGGLVWWKDFIVCGCYNTKTESDEVRFYPKGKQLDHNSAVVWKSQASVISLNIFRDILIIFSGDWMLTLCSLERKQADTPSVLIRILQIISVENIAPHPHCVVSVDLTPLRTEAGQRKHPGTREAESLLINVCGRLWIIQREPDLKADMKTESRDSVNNIITPMLLSSCVEMLWVYPGLTPSREKPQLSEALWMFCGAHGMKVWVPLFSKEVNKRTAFHSRRIMLPNRLKILPLCVLFDEAMVHGAESDFMFDSCSVDGKSISLPAFTVQRTSEVYLPQVLRQLLRKNLGAHALDIAQTCTKLPYFNHSLELLLHQVLEEEGTCSEPIPDPLLPSVVAFVQEFPVFLQTIAHCARKSDIALWPQLFAEAGEPLDLFRECLDSNQLNIAASFLIILNNTLSVSSVKKQALILHDRAKADDDSSLVHETVRFLRALDLEEQEGQRKTPENLNSSKSPTGLQHSVSVGEGSDYASPLSPQGTSTFKYGPTVRTRTTSESVQKAANLKRTSSAPFARDDIMRSVSLLSSQTNGTSAENGSMADVGEKVDPANPSSSVNYMHIPVSSSTPSMVSKQKWNRRRFPGYAQAKLDGPQNA